MKKKVFIFCLVSCIFIFLLMAQAVYARFTLTPSISLKEEYNDNIYLTPDNEEDDLITTVSPSINLGYEARLFNFSLTYTLLSKFYIHNSKENDFYHQIIADSTINLYKNILFIHITDNYKRIPIDEKRQTALDNILVNMTDTNTFTFNPYIVYPLDATLSARIDYIYENIWYKQRSGDDTKNHTFSISLSKEFSDRLKTTLSYSYLVHKPRFTEEYDRQSVKADVEYVLGPALTLKGGLGHTWFDYDSSAISDENYSFYDAGFNYKLSEVVNLDASYKVDYVESVTTGTYKSRTYEGILSYAKFITSKLTAFHKKSEYIEQNREDKSTGISIDLSMPITEKLTGGITGSYTKYTFLPEDVKDKRYSLKVSIGYQLRITTINIGYTYNKNNSTDDTKDYTNNILWAQARITF